MTNPIKNTLEHEKINQYIFDLTELIYPGRTEYKVSVINLGKSKGYVSRVLEQGDGEKIFSNREKAEQYFDLLVLKSTPHRSRVQEADNKMKITRRQIRRIIQEVNKQPTPTIAAKEINDARHQLKDHFKNLESQYKRRPDVKMAGLQEKELEIYILFRGRKKSSTHGALSAEIQEVLHPWGKSLEVAVEWYYDMDGESVKDQQGHYVSQESGEEFLKLTDFADDRDYMVEDYVNYVKEYIGQTLAAMSAGAGAQPGGRRKK